MADITQREGIKVRGIVKIDTFRAGFAELAELRLDTIRDYKRLLLNRPTEASAKWLSDKIAYHLEKYEELRNQYLIGTAVECPNLVMDSPNYGIDLIIQQLVGVNIYTLSLDFIEIGTGSTTPTITDTALTTPTNRAAVGFQQDYGTTDAIVQAIFSDSQLANGTYYEMGTFCGGTSTIGSGQIFNHALLSSAYTKISGQDTSIQVDFSFS